MSFTFFDLVSAMRQVRALNFLEPSRETVSIPISLRNISRDGRTWEIIGGSGEVFRWSETNQPPLVISAASSPVRAVAHFGYFDLMDAIRSARSLKFTLSGVDVVARPVSVSNRSRNSSLFSIVTTSGTFSWTDDNSGPTVISEI